MMRILAIGLKDVRVTVRDKPALGILLGMPMVLIFILGSALGGIGKGGAGRVPIAVVALDRGEAGTRIAEAFESTELEDVFEAHRFVTEAAARRAVERGDLAAALVIPERFSDDLTAGSGVSLRVWADPGREVAAGIVRAVAESLATRVSAVAVAAQVTGEAVGRSGLSRDPRVAMAAARSAADELGRADGLARVRVAEAKARLQHKMTTLDYYAGGMSVMFLLFGSMFGAFSLVEERTGGTLARLLAGPVSRVQALAGKTLGVFVVGVVQALTLYGFTRLLGVAWGPDVLALGLIGFSTIVAVTGMALMLSTLAKSVRGVGAIAPLVIQVQAAAGGSFFPVSALPEWLRPVHYLTVNGWALDGILAVMRGAGVAEVWPKALALLGLGALFFAIGVWRLETS
ncbi:MAG: ABC transporter permease [Coriobacteriia bacterium]